MYVARMAVFHQAGTSDTEPRTHAAAESTRALARLILQRKCWEQAQPKRSRHGLGSGWDTQHW